LGELTRTASMTVRFTSRYRSTLLAKNPLNYWRLGETWGSTAYDTKGVRNGTYCSGVILGQPGAILHDSDKAPDFDGSNDHVDLGKMNVYGDKVTFVAWFKADINPNADAAIICKASGTGNSDHYWAMGLTKGTDKAKIYFRLDVSNLKLLLSPGVYGSTCDVGTWIFAAGTYDGAMMRIYQNGVEVASRKATGVIGTSATVSAWIGGNPSSEIACPFNGILDEVAVFSRALSADEINAIYAARVPDAEIISWGQ